MKFWKITKSWQLILKSFGAEFAFNCDISVETLSLIEREKTDPRLSSVQKIAAYSGVSVKDLFSE